MKGKWLDNWTFKQTTIDRSHTFPFSPPPLPLSHLFPFPFPLPPFPPSLLPSPPPLSFLFFHFFSFFFRDHPVAIAYGPPNEALPTFLQTFTTPPPDIQPQQPQQQQEQQHKNFKFRPLPPTKHVFRVLEIQDLLPLKS